LPKNGSRNNRCAHSLSSKQVVRGHQELGIYSSGGETNRSGWPPVQGPPRSRGDRDGVGQMRRRPGTASRTRERSGQQGLPPHCPERRSRLANLRQPMIESDLARKHRTSSLD
jgi:hypothetical protein